LQETIFYWGTIANPANTMIRVDDLPTDGAGAPLTDTWMRLDLPVARGTRQTSSGVLPNPLLTEPLDNLQFGVLSGATGASVRWGYAGVAGSGTESYWVADAFPPGSELRPATGFGAVWDALGEMLAPFEEQSFGVVTSDGFRFSVQELDALIERYRKLPGGIGRELGEAWERDAWEGRGDDGSRSNRAKAAPTRAIALGALAASAQTLPPLIEQGLNALIARLDQRIAAGDDHVEVGFLRTRTDIFRLRQGVLGTTLAGRLLTSPAAAELVQRSETAVATDKVFADYFDRAKTRTVTP
jgi:hypothetical protein